MKKKMSALKLLLSACLCLASSAGAQTVLVEAESFANRGGWVVDQQFMDQMGSPFLMAHGLGIPCADATKEVVFPETGAWYVWVRTRNWVSNWGFAEGPGQFQLVVNGNVLDVVFGKSGGAWHWQDGGSIKIKSRNVSLALRDLTGFNGRCDAVVFARDPGFRPPNELKALATFRKRALGLTGAPRDAGEFDLVVVGGGVAGTAAAVSAARLGVKVALIQNRPVLGGNSSSEVRVSPGGNLNQEPYPALGNLVWEIVPVVSRGNAHEAVAFEDDKKQRVVDAEDNISLFLNTHAFQVETKGNRIAAILAKNIETSEELRFGGRFFADCTGDGTIGYLAGADYRMGRECQADTGESLAPEKADTMTMGATVMWRSRQSADPTSFPECLWAVQFSERNARRTTKAEWFWETGMNLDQIEDFEQIRDHGLRAAFGNWDFVKNKSRDRAMFAERELEWVAYISGKRESRRLLGDVILQEQDILGRREFPDASVTCTWSIDLHYPDPKNTEDFPGEEFLSIAVHKRYKPGYPIPYRCFYSRNIENLFMAGRDISVTHVALGTVRVMRTTGMMGEVVGMAASICNDCNTTPRGVYQDHLDKLKALMRKGIGASPPPPPPLPPPPKPPAWLDTAGENLARTARVRVSGNYDLKKYPVANINDGRYDVNNNSLRWVSDNSAPGTVELAWDKPQAFNAARIVTGQSGGGRPQTPITGFSLQYYAENRWRDIPGSRVAANTLIDWGGKFDRVTTSRLRIVVYDTPGSLTRIWEFEVYDVKGGKKSRRMAA
jgi:hypothetical protein